MDRKVMMAAAIGLVISLALALFNIYLAGIAIIIVIVLVMSLFIMQDSAFLPDIEAELRPDAKAVIMRNSGNAVATRIHAALVPLNIEFDLPDLAAEKTSEYLLPSMIDHAKLVVTFENEKGGKFEREFMLNALTPPYDPLKPMIPMFKWK